MVGDGLCWLKCGMLEEGWYDGRLVWYAGKVWNTGRSVAWLEMCGLMGEVWYVGRSV